MSDKRNDSMVELSKSLVGCLGPVAAALVTGVFGLVTVIGARLLAPADPTPVVVPTPIIIAVAASATYAPSLAVQVPPTLAPPTTAPPTLAQPTLPLSTRAPTVPVPAQFTPTTRASNTAPPPTRAPSTAAPPTRAPNTAAPPTLAPATLTPFAGAFGPIVIAADSTIDYKPVDAALHYPEGVTQISAIFPFQGMTDGTAWRCEWYLDGRLKEELTTAKPWARGERGTHSVGAYNAKGLSTGKWEVRLYLGGLVVQKGSFTIDKREAGKPYFGPIRFAEGIQDEKPVGVHDPSENFDKETGAVYAFFDAGNMTKGLSYRREWYRDDVLLADLMKSLAWDADATETDWWMQIHNDKGLTPGTYEIKLYIQDKLVQLGTFIVN